MKPIIFARVADMKYYKGITDSDIPDNGGSYVKDTGLAHECFNFYPFKQDGEDYEKCIGYCQLSGGSGVGQLHIEKIVGCSALKKEELCEGVIVVFVSKSTRAKTMRVVGFYKNAIVYRYPHFMDFGDDDNQMYWFEAKREDCVVLPFSTRHSEGAWYVPQSSTNKEAFGMGRSNIWYAGSNGAGSKETEYVEKMIQSIENYNGENWIDKEVF